MPTSCSVSGCTNQHSKEHPRQFFHFPLKNEPLTMQWLQALRRNNFTPTRASRICSDHFVEDDYLKRPNTYVKRLKPNAVPSLFPKFPEVLILDEKPPRILDTDFSFPPIKIVKVEGCVQNEEACTSRMSVASQTTFAQNEELRRDKLIKKIRMLQQKIRRRDTKISNMSETINQLQKKLIAVTKGELLSQDFNCITDEVIKNE